MLRIAAFLGLMGLAAATGLILWSGWHQVVTALEQTGWGIPVLAVFHMLPITVSAFGWRVLVSARQRPSLARFTFFMWVRAAVNNLMPVARIGGEIVAVRLMVASNMRKSIAIAITVVELTTSISAIFLFVIIGVIMFVVRVNDHNVTAQLGWAIVLSLPLLSGLVLVQRIGFFALLSKLFRLMFRDKWSGFMGNAARLDRAVMAVYRRHHLVMLCGVIQFIGWALGAVDIYLALTFLGHPLPWSEAVMIEALIEASASAAFAVPGALGVQEAGFVVFGGMLGLSHESAAALAVMRRCRDLICYVPALLAWQAQEGKKILKWRT